MKFMKAGLPLTETLVPSKDVGSLPPANSAEVQDRVVEERFVPVIVIHEFCVMPEAKLAPLTTPEMVGLITEGTTAREIVFVVDILGVAESVTVTTTELVPDDADVPEMAPVPDASVRFSGKPVADQVYAPVPPEALKVVAYKAP